MIDEFNSAPYIGQIVDYFPTPSERRAAIVVEVFPLQESLVQKVNLITFQTDGIGVAKILVRQVDPSAVEGEDEICNIADCWAFQHTISIQQEPDADPAEEYGSKSNRTVGTNAPY